MVKKIYGDQMSTTTFTYHMNDSQVKHISLEVFIDLL